MYELFTLGGGTYLVDLLNAVAAITGGGAYITLAQLAGVAGLAWVLFRTAFGGSWKDNAKWMLLFVTVWGAMIVPKATVRVVDRLDPTLAPAVVANVPIGLALFASLTSQVGDGLTRLTEQAFTLPNDLQYRRHGLIFGARLAAKTTRMEITDTVFAATHESLRLTSRVPFFLAGKHPRIVGRAGEAVEHSHDGGGERHHASTRFCVGEPHLAGVEVEVVPPQPEDFVAAASGEHEEPDGGGRVGRGEPLFRGRPQRLAEPEELFAGQEPLVLLDPEAGHAPGRVAARGTPAPPVRQVEHLDQHVGRPVGDCRHVVQAVVKGENVLVFDVRDEALAEGRHDMLAQHEAVMRDRSAGLQCIATYSRS